MRSKLAFVTPWYGNDIPGGAESLCRGVVKALIGAGASVEVLTTCVRQFASDWNRNYYPEGRTLEDGVPVQRFAVRSRNAMQFDQVNHKLMNDMPVTPEEEQIFVREMINSPALYDYIACHRNEYVFFFLPYMFGTTYWGSAVCPDRSIVIPCLHDEAYARMQPFRDMCERVQGLIFNSAEEQRLAQNLYSLDSHRLAVLGVPVNCAWSSDPRRFRRKHGIHNFFLYAGRTEKGKGADLLVDYYCRFLDDTATPEQLVFIGGGEIEIPQRYRSQIVRLGFLPEQDKYDAYSAAIALCVPSIMESFSIVTMESWLAGRPVIANQACAVTTDFCTQSNGGLYFADYEEFREILILLMSNPELAAGLGAQGRQYVLLHYHPQVVAARYLSILEEWGF